MGKKMAIATASLLGIGAAGAGGVAYMNHELHDASNLGPLPLETPELTTRQESYLCFSELPNCDRIGALAILSGGGNNIQVSLEQIDDDIEHALIAAEDRRFYQHDGIDNPGIARAILANGWASLRESLGDGSPQITFKQGASTLEMQLARNLYLADLPVDELDRKYWEAEQALKLNRDYSKDEILEKYLNTVNFGRGTRGIETASWAYFGHPAVEMDIVKAATVTAVVNDPSNLEGSKVPERDASQRADLQARRNKIIGDMAEVGYITAEEAALYQAVPIDSYLLPYNVYSSAASNDYSIANSLGARHFVDMVLNQVKEESGYSDRQLSQNLRINTTLSLFTQAAVNEAVQSADYPRDGRQLAAVVLRKDGAIAGMYGGDYQELQVNLAMRPIVTGSGDKPWAYLQAFESGQVNLDSVYADPPSFVWEGGDNGKDWPVNTGNYCASDQACTVREAIAKSSNMVILQVMKDGGQASLDRMDQLMDAFHIPSDTAPTPAIVLGAREATLLDRTTGMNGLIANHGKAVDHFLIESVYALEDDSFVPKYDGRAELPEPIQVIPVDIADMAIEGMRGVIRDGTASANLGDFPTDAAGKTGTHDDNVAASFIGSGAFGDGSYTIGVLLSYPNELRSLGDGQTGGKVPTAVWRAIGMKLVDGDKPL